jgi:hypothetical protein
VRTLRVEDEVAEAVWDLHQPEAEAAKAIESKRPLTN